MKMIITFVLFVITFILSIFGIKKGENSHSIFQEKHQFIIVQTNIALNNETKK
jgi:hypothetical protein